SYVNEKTPPYTVEDVLSFYEQCRFDYGVSVDHVILGFQSDQADGATIDSATLRNYRERQDITLVLAREFLTQHKRQKQKFTPVGVAQGWSPSSYVHSVRQLQKMGYSYVGLGGLVPLKTDEILAVLQKIATVRRPSTRFHLFGVNRCEHLKGFSHFGVVSF